MVAALYIDSSLNCDQVGVGDSPRGLGSARSSASTSQPTWNGSRRRLAIQHSASLRAITARQLQALVRRRAPGVGVGLVRLTSRTATTSRVTDCRARHLGNGPASPVASSGGGVPLTVDRCGSLEVESAGAMDRAPNR